MVQDERRRRSRHAHAPNQIQVRFSVDFDVTHTVHRRRDMSQHLTGRSARSAERTGELHQGRPLPRILAEVGTGQRESDVSPLRRRQPPGGPGPPESEDRRRQQHDDEHDQSGGHAVSTSPARRGVPVAMTAGRTGSGGGDDEHIAGCRHHLVVADLVWTQAHRAVEAERPSGRVVAALGNRPGRRNLAAAVKADSDQAAGRAERHSGHVSVHRGTPSPGEQVDVEDHGAVRAVQLGRRRSWSP